MLIISSEFINTFDQKEKWKRFHVLQVSESKCVSSFLNANLSILFNNFWYYRPYYDLYLDVARHMQSREESFRGGWI